MMEVNRVKQTNAKWAHLLKHNFHVKALKPKSLLQLILESKMNNIYIKLAYRIVDLTY